MAPDHVSTMHWDHAVSIARQTCARLFRDGAAPADALQAFGINPPEGDNLDWSRAIDRIAEVICANERSARRAA